MTGSYYWIGYKIGFSYLEKVTVVTKIFYILQFLLIYLAIPFKVFITKEFLLVAYDELRNRSMTNKLEEYKLY